MCKWGQIYFFFFWRWQTTTGCVQGHWRTQPTHGNAFGGGMVGQTLQPSNAARNRSAAGVGTCPKRRQLDAARGSGTRQIRGTAPHDRNDRNATARNLRCPPTTKKEKIDLTPVLFRSCSVTPVLFDPVPVCETAKCGDRQHCCLFASQHGPARLRRVSPSTSSTTREQFRMCQERKR